MIEGFIHMFGFYMLVQGVNPVYYIENVPLFVLVVLGLSIPVSYLISRLDKKVGKVIRGKDANKYSNELTINMKNEEG